MVDDEPSGAMAPLSPLPPSDPASVTVVRRGRGRWVIGSLSLVAVIVAAIVVLARGQDPDAEGALAAAQAVAEDASSFRFEIHETRRVVTGDPDRAGSDTTVRSFTEGTVAAEDRWRVLTEDGEAFGIPMDPWEMIRMGPHEYHNGPVFSEPVEGVDAPRWIRSEVGDTFTGMDDLVAEVEMMAEDAWWPDDEADDTYMAEVKLDLAVGAYLRGAWPGQPHDLKQVVLEAGEPAVEERLVDGGLRLRVRLEPVDRIEEASGLDLPPVDVLLDLDEQERPVRARFSASVEGATADIEIRFSDWGADLTVEPPDPADIDETPWMQEEALATVPDLLVMPTSLPGDLHLVGATMHSFAGPDCPSVDLSFETEEAYALDPAEIDWDEETWLQGPGLHLSASPAACSDEYSDEPFGETLGGLPARDDMGWEVLLGDAWIVLQTELEGDELEALVSSFRVVSLDEMVAAIPEWAESPLWW